MTERGALAGEIPKLNKGSFDISKINDEIKSEKNLPDEASVLNQTEENTEVISVCG